MKIGNRYLAGITALLALAAISSCSKLSHVGDQTEPAPHAVAVTIGESYTNDSSGNLQATVRAGSEVVLSGKESEKGDNDTGVPLVNFKWEQLTPGSNAVQLVARTSNTVSFTAPQVTAVTTLNFKLTVSDVKGNAASTEAHITVQPVRDQDHFVQYLNVSNTIPVVMATQTAIAADSSANATATLPVTITITKLVTFPDRNDSTVTHTRVAVGTPVTISTGWNAKLGSSTSCTGNENPTIQVPVPRLNLDDTLPAGAFPDAVILSDALEPSDIDQATLEVRIDIASTNSAVTNSTPVACVNGTASASASVFATEALMATASPRDSKAATQAYYATIDPTASKNTLNKWLDANGFSSSVSGWNADAHAVYTNNFDLGFGRDMYMKIGGATGKCDDGTSALPVTQAHINSGLCDVAAVVVNYSGVEAAAKKLNPIIAVAMEYSAPASGGARIVKFYTFAPDTRTGDYKRVLSVNLDRRGEQYMPQACVVCHGGTPGTIDGSGKYNGNGDVKAGFLPWDLDSLLYSDTDPGFSTKSRNASLRVQYTRSMQEAQLKTLNLGAYLTFADPAGATGRYAVMRELLEGWYHGSSTTGLTATTFDGSFVPQGWKPNGLDGVANTGDDNPSDSATIYTNVFARNCRMCHTLQVPASTVDNPIIATVCSKTSTTASVGATDQFPMGCYWEFAHAPSLTDMLAKAQMPFARRTMDRMWLAADGTTTGSAGAMLAQHLGKQPSDLMPGTPVAAVALSQRQTSGIYQALSKISDGVFSASRKRVIQADGSGSLFAAQFNYSLTPPSNSAVVLVGATGTFANFVPDIPGSYSLLLDVGANTKAAVTVNVLNIAPTLGADTYPTVQGGTINVAAQDANNLLASAADADGDTLTIALVAADTACPATAHAASLTVGSDGSFVYRHNGDLPSPSPQTDQFKVQASDGYGGVATACVHISITKAPDTTFPSAPTAVSATPISTGSGPSTTFPVNLTWAPATDQDNFNNGQVLAAYKIYRCEGGAIACRSNFVGSTDGATTSFQDPSPTHNHSYVYSVAAVDGSGNATYSADKSVTTLVSYNFDIDPIWSSTLDSGQANKCVACHDGNTSGAPNYNGTEQNNYTVLTGTSGPVTKGTMPCWPALNCASGTTVNGYSSHYFGTSLEALSTNTDAAHANRKAAYDKILNWINQGHKNN